jgi:hypothetical protein
MILDPFRGSERMFTIILNGSRSIQNLEVDEDDEGEIPRINMAS